MQALDNARRAAGDLVEPMEWQGQEGLSLKRAQEAAGLAAIRQMLHSQGAAGRCALETIVPMPLPAQLLGWLPLASCCTPEPSSQVMLQGQGLSLEHAQEAAGLAAILHRAQPSGGTCGPL